MTNLEKVDNACLTDPVKWNIDENASFFHVCTNETVGGLEFTDTNFPWHLIPKDVPIVADMSSHIGTFNIDWSRYSVVYAGAQKNLGPAGCTVVICKKSLLGYADPDTPLICDWLAFEKAPDA